LFATPELVRGRGTCCDAGAICSWTKVLEASGLIFQIVSEAIRTNRTITAYEEEVRSELWHSVQGSRGSLRE
jgi:hypothetical protein